VASLAPAPAASDSVPAPSTARAKLRVGVFADGARQPRWIVEALAKVAASEFAELAVVCLDHKATASRQPLLWQAYRRADRRLFGATDWSEPRDVEQLVPASRRMTLEAFSRPSALAPHPALDVAFALGDVDDAALAGLARCGVWRYCFGDEHAIHEPLAGVREVIDGAPVTASGIRIHRDGGQPDRVVYQSWSRTLPLSVARSRENVFAKATEFVARALRELHVSGLSWLDKGTRAASPLSAQDVPGSSAPLGDVARLGARLARRGAQKVLGVEQWSLAFRFAPAESWDGSLAGFHRLEPPKDRFWADPFPIQRHGKSYIFFEELPFGAGKAHISVIEVDRHGRASQPLRVLERDYHLSYPFLVEDEGQLYMIPESARNNAVEIYRCLDFPHKWRRERALLDGLFAVDATPYRAKDRWWMFANVSNNGAEIHDELHLFSAGALLGEWKPHRRNPVKSDVRNARPAGRLFSHGHRLYRPAQICAPIYGAGVALNRVLRLDADEFVEQEERRILPAAGSGVLGIHTLNRDGDLSVADAFVRRSRF
jgi:hypothetical protein